MIHIAPCSCELHQALREALERNRELEAELARRRYPTCKQIPGPRWHAELHVALKAAMARAEKAEATRDALQADLHRLLQEWNSHDEALRKAEARVAELERWLEDFGITREASEHRLARMARATNLED